MGSRNRSRPAATASTTTAETPRPTRPPLLCVSNQPARNASAAPSAATRIAGASSRRAAKASAGQNPARKNAAWPLTYEIGNTSRPPGASSPGCACSSSATAAATATAARPADDDERGQTASAAPSVSDGRRRTSAYSATRSASSRAADGTADHVIEIASQTARPSRSRTPVESGGRRPPRAGAEEDGGDDERDESGVARQSPATKLPRSRQASTQATSATRATGATSSNLARVSFVSNLRKRLIRLTI